MKDFYLAVDLSHFFLLKFPRTISCNEWSGVAEDLSARCHHQYPCMKLVAFESVDSGRKFLACAEKVRPSFVVTNHLLDVIQTLPRSQPIHTTPSTKRILMSLPLLTADQMVRFVAIGSCTVQGLKS